MHVCALPRQVADTDDALNAVATGQENIQCSSRALGAGVGERTRTSKGSPAHQVFSLALPPFPTGASAPP